MSKFQIEFQYNHTIETATVTKTGSPPFHFSVHFNNPALIEEMKSMVVEFKKQTQEFEYQTGLMRDSNEILKDQVSVLSASIQQEEKYQQVLDKSRMSFLIHIKRFSFY